MKTGKGMRINLKITVRIWNYAKRLSAWIILLWLLETIYFLIAEGWHWKATSKAEVVCDTIIGVAVNIIIILTIVVSVNVLDYLLAPSKSEEEPK